MTYQQEAPFTIKIEATEGCNLGCSFCGIHSIGLGQVGAKGSRYMVPEIAQSVAEQAFALGWNFRVEMAMHGEPTLNPALPELIRPFASQYVMVTSNGGGLLMDTVARVQALFDAGLNTLALDDYQTNRIIERFLENTGYNLGASPFDIRFYPKDKSANPHRRHKGQMISVMEDLNEATAGTHADVHNTAGDSGPLDASFNDKRCARPFRELAVRWDGHVAICCMDWPGTFKVGNVMTDGLETIWQHERMQAAREALYHRRRDLIPTCDGCTAKSYRVGLLPDKKGRVELPMPTFDTTTIIEEACEGEPYTPRIRPRFTYQN